MKTGVKQGCLLAPCLFNLFVDTIARQIMAAIEQYGVKVVYKLENIPHLMVLRKPSVHMLVWLLMYADDITLICHSAEDMSNMVSQVHHIMSQWGMSVSVKKSKLMVVSKDKDVQVPTVTIDGLPLEVVDSFICLGSKFTRDNSIEAEVSFRISRACAAFANLKHFFCGHSYISIGTKVNIFNATVMASLLYGCKAWTLTEKQINPGCPFMEYLWRQALRSH